MLSIPNVRVKITVEPAMIYDHSVLDLAKLK